jgi:hypothetical protein
MRPSAETDENFSELENQRIKIQSKDEKILYLANKNAFLRLLSLISSTLLIIIIGISIVNFLVLKSNKTIMSFEFSNETNSFDIYTPFSTSSISFIACLLIIAGILIFFCVNLIWYRDTNFLHIFYIDVSLFTPIMNVFFSSMLIIGILYEKFFLSILINFILNFGCLVCTIILYKKVKQRKNFSHRSLISHNIFSSILLSFQCYIFLYNIVSMITYEDGSPHTFTDGKANYSLSANCLYGAIGVALITTYKDINFCILLELIEVGYLTTAKMLSYKEIITSIAILGFIFVSMMITVIKYKKIACGYEENDDIIRELEKCHAEQYGNNIKDIQ